MRSLDVWVEVLQDTVNVSLEGTFTLPSREYTAADLKRIARDINRALRENTTSDCFEE